MKKHNFKETQKSIIQVNEIFTSLLAKELNLQKIVGPLIIDPNTNLNDNLTRNNHAVSFFVQALDKNLEIVQSLAKWKRFALKKYEFNTYEGIYVDMRAIRSHETLDELHSLYVDQWDWEMIIEEKDRNIEFLKQIVEKIYKCLYLTEDKINETHLHLSKKLPNKIKFISSQEIEDKMGTKYNEAINTLVKKYGAIFVYQIGGKLKSGNVFDERSYEYDDWSLNGDLFVYSNVIKKPIEISSMGIRVDKNSLIKQGDLDLSKISNNYYHKLIIEKKLPYTIGGGIGQSRINMFLLEKTHIGEVQSSVWDDKTYLKAKNKKMPLL